MKSKIFALVLLTTLLVSFTSALTFTVSNDLTNARNSTIITLTAGALNETLSFGTLSNIVEGSETVVLAHSAYPTFLNASESKTFTINAASISDGFSLGKHSTTLLVTSTDGNGTNTNVSIPINYVMEFCEDGNIEAGKIRISKIEDVLSEDEWKWKPRDQVEVEVKIENKLDRDEDFIVALGIYDTQDKNFVEIDGDDFIEEELSLDEDDKDTVTFAFEVPIDLEESTGRYTLYIKAYVDGDEDLFCNSGKATDLDSSVDSLKISRERNDVVLDEITAPETVTPGETVKVSVKAFNVGTEDEKKVKVVLRNQQLGISQESTAFRLDVDDSEKVEFEFIVPANAKTGTYELELHTLFDYDKNQDEYDKESEETWTVNIKVLGGRTDEQQPIASITASLDSEAKAGEELVISATVKNTGSSTATYAIDVKGYDSWATLNSISERLITLQAGESKTLTLKFGVLKTAVGEESFTIETNSAGKIAVKEVAVNIAEAPKGGIDFSNINFKGNGLIWVIGAVNLILIILIIVVAIRISRR